MRALVLAAVFALIATAVGSAQAAPTALRPAAAAPAITLVRGGCGPGWHPTWWRGPHGHLHHRCVPNH